MNNKTAYLLAGQCLEPIAEKCDAHLLHAVADKIASALVEASREADQLRTELDAVDAAMGEFYVPVRDPETGEPGGAFYKDHGVHIVIDELERTMLVNSQLRAKLAAVGKTWNPKEGR